MLLREITDKLIRTDGVITYVRSDIGSRNVGSEVYSQIIQDTDNNAEGDRALVLREAA